MRRRVRRHLVQSPLPHTLGKSVEQQVFDLIDPAKDVDCFHPQNVGRLVQGRAILGPCTPSGVIELLQREQIPTAGRRAVVIGRSDIVGKPMALLLLQRDATVSVCHSKTRICGDVRGGRHPRGGHRPARLRHRGFCEARRVVIDVGINPLSRPRSGGEAVRCGQRSCASFDQKGTAITGDVHPEVAEVAGALTPVPEAWDR
jgi:methylenetetrahydrofolate dehydrogenase (NADP+)/methenyltetrahydrofolate cyclohydrolase